MPLVDTMTFDEAIQSASDREIQSLIFNLHPDLLIQAMYGAKKPTLERLCRGYVAFPDCALLREKLADDCEEFPPEIVAAARREALFMMRGHYA